MKTLALFFMALMVTATAAHADTGDGPAADTMFAKLQTQFAQGTQVNLKALVGKLDSGRCFTLDAPDNPIASALSVAFQPVDNGPLGSGQPQFTASVSAEPTLASDYFDHAALTDSNVDSDRLPLRTIDAKTYQLDVQQSDGAGSLQFRAVGSSIVALGLGDGFTAASDAVLMCYYFDLH